MSKLESQVLALVEELTDEFKWNWTDITDERSAARAVLHRMAVLGIIEHKHHPLGGDIYIYKGQMFGRTDKVRLSSPEPRNPITIIHPDR